MIVHPDFQSWRQALEAVETRLTMKSRSALGFQVVIVLACYSATIVASGYSWMWVMLLTALVPTLILIGQTSSKKLRSRSVSHPDSGNPIRDVRIAERILAGEINGNELCQFIPQPYGLLARRRTDPTPQQVIERVIFAMDWYCGPPRRFFPPLWFCTSALIAASLLGLAIILSFQIQLGFFLEHLWLGVFLLSFINLADPELNSLDMLADEFTRLEQLPGPLTASDAPAGYVKPSPGDTTARNVHSMMLPAINLLAQNTGRIQFCFLRPCSLMPMITCGILMFASISTFEPYLLVIIPLMMLVCISSPIFIQGIARYGNCGKAYRERVRVRLAESDLPVRIVNEEIPALINRLNVPLVFRPLLLLPHPPQGFTNHLVRDIWQASNNLDWLLDPPRVAIRVWWLLLVIQIFCLLAAISGATFSRIATQGPVLPGSVVSADLIVCIVALVLVFACAAPGWIHDGRMIIWREELLNELHESMLK